MAKSEELAPETAMLPMVIALELPLVSVTVWTGLVDPTVVAGKAMLNGAAVAVTTVVLPVPERATV